MGQTSGRLAKHFSSWAICSLAFGAACLLNFNGSGQEVGSDGGGLHQGLRFAISAWAIYNPPRSDAGSDATIPVGAAVVLDGGSSVSPGGTRLTYSWSFVSRPAGSTATLDSTSAFKPSFTPDLAGGYELQLTVMAGTSGSDSDTVVVATGNLAPVPEAGPDTSSADGTQLRFDPDGSDDADGDRVATKGSLIARPFGRCAPLLPSSLYLSSSATGPAELVSGEPS